MIAPDLEAAAALRRAPMDIPLVAAEAGPGDVIPVVAVDQYAGAVSATRHLLDLGHETVWHISARRTGSNRVSASTAGAATVGRPVRLPPPLLAGDWSARSGYDLGRRLSRDPAVTAIFAANDQMALGCAAGDARGRPGVPGEVSVVGFDDIPEAPYFTPPLTTVRQDFIEVGSA